MVSFFITSDKRDLWILEELREIRDLIINRYQYDIEALRVVVREAELIEGEAIGQEAVIEIRNASHTLLSLMLKDLKYAPFPHVSKLTQFCSTYEGEYYYNLTDLELAHGFLLYEELKDQEIRALTHVLCLLLMRFFEHILVEEKEITRMPSAFQETWVMMFSIHEGKRFEFDGIRYWRGDHPASLHPTC